MPAPRQLEYRALNLLEALGQGRSPADADATAALYRRWPGPAALTARRLAAHANAARGRDVLWLIGVDTNDRAMSALNAPGAAATPGEAPAPAAARLAGWWESARVWPPWVYLALVAFILCALEWWGFHRRRTE